jgi:antitoxin component of MazEF toxin-antitoxin module
VGKSLAVRLPADVAEKAGIAADRRVDVAVEDGNIVIRRAAPRYTSKELFHGKSPEEWSRFYAGASSVLPGGLQTIFVAARLPRTENRVGETGDSENAGSKCAFGYNLGRLRC